jgi:CMP-N-acetylneuraminic acid synthetase
MVNRTAVAIIPARGGSKGIPRKNLCLLGDKPLVAHSIDAALAAAAIDRVVVSTEDPEIAAVARQYGADVVWRPTALSGDTASSESALIHTLEHLRVQDRYVPDLTVFVQCTTPLILPEDLDGTIACLDTEQADVAFAVTPTHAFIWQRDADGHVVPVNHRVEVRARRQELSPQYLETGAVFAMRTAGFLEAGRRFFGRLAMFEIPAERAVEIDDAVGLALAERVHARLAARPAPRGRTMRRRRGRGRITHPGLLHIS